MTLSRLISLSFEIKYKYECSIRKISNVGLPISHMDIQPGNIQKLVCMYVFFFSECNVSHDSRQPTHFVVARDCAVT